MTEVEFSRLLSELTASATVLNRESDSINDAIEAVEEKLREINLGLDVWLRADPIASETTDEEGRDGELYETGRDDAELGFTKMGTEWTLAVRRASYKYEEDGWNNRSVVFKYAQQPTRLLECSRAYRIEALKRFPRFVQLMNAEAKAAVDAIDAAKKLVR